MDIVTTPQQMMFSCFLVETDTKCGTCFMAGYGGETYLVTAWHVIEGATTGCIRFVRERYGQPAPGEHACFTVNSSFSGLWHRYDNDVDVAIMPVKSIREKSLEPIFTRGINLDNEHFPAFWNEFDAVEELISIGFPFVIQDAVYLLPVARQGITASPAAGDWSGRREFLADMAVFPGASGSPVFVTDRYYNALDRFVTAGRPRFTFAGLLTEYMPRIIPAKVQVVDEATAEATETGAEVEVPLHLHLGKVVKAQCIIEAIQDLRASTEA